MSVTVDVRRDLADAALVATWDALADADPTATMFQRPRFLTAWAQVFATDRDPRALVVLRDGAPIGVAALADHDEGVRLLGGDEVTDYLGPVARPADRDAVAAAVLEHVAQRPDDAALVATGLATDTGWPAAFATAAATLGMRVDEAGPDGVCPRVDLTGGTDGWLERLPGRLRQELVRKSRKLERDAGGAELVEVAPADVAAGIDAFLAQVVEAFPDKSAFFAREDVRRWFAVLAGTFASDRTMRLHRLDVGVLPAAMTVSFVERGEWGLYNSSFDPTLSLLAPGFVLVGMLVEAAADEGCATFDLLRGDEAYKYRFGAVDRPLERLTVRPAARRSP
jgi:CelD/BcsL family acetyltransferase involved in cellulose biosynthesis